MDVSALDESGNKVDWWFIYKVPQLGPGMNNDSATGYEYVYYDSALDQIPTAKVAKSDFLLNSGNGALNHTLDSVFGGTRDVSTGYVLYNDEMPVSVGRRDDGNVGHTKGVIAFDTASETAYWLLHSWPKFADPGATGDPTPIYGQTYLCLSLNINTARQIAAQMRIFQEPQTYDAVLANLSDQDDLRKLADPLKANKPGTNTLQLKTIGDMDFRVIAKNREWKGDFWNGLVGPELGEDMDVETWVRGLMPPIADTDGIHKTFDIKYIDLGPLGAHWVWPETHDHAKWGITVKSDWVCIGDINRMISQRQRGGGAIAFQNNKLWQALSKTGLVLAPPGTKRSGAHEVIQRTHSPHSMPARP